MGAIVELWKDVQSIAIVFVLQVMRRPLVPLMTQLMARTMRRCLYPMPLCPMSHAMDLC